MIIEFSVENFLSFKERVTLSMDSSSSKKIPQNIIKVPNNGRLLKSVAIYGANSSGKSNLLKAIDFMCWMITYSHNFNVNTQIPVTPFKLSTECSRNPSYFEMKFIHENITYRYGFSCNSKKIVSEYLFYFTGKKENKIFERKDKENFDFPVDNEQQNLIKPQVIENTLYLSRATQLGYQKTKNPYKFFTESLVININPTWTNYTLNRIYKNPEFKDKILEIMKKADFGGIEDIKIKKEIIPIKEVKFSVNQRYERDTTGDFFDLKFIHKAENGKDILFDALEESEGTQKALAILGPLFDIMENGKVAFIDELGCSLHPEITRLLIRLFHSDKNKNGQLIFTTHDTTLLDNELLRMDQIYFCSKEPNKYTQLSSLLDYDIRQVTDFERAYLSGRVGGVPFIDETLLS
ncbi:AAA family ATPase [Methanosarcina sp. DH2]|uniref:AAA family ATPase n=1 Tax=Methanosarcina sp. DH2 TaxID=2605639 RepID=UPI001E4BCC51|nr:ATP-binding protein [Methanosarcina sp. DH2]MCC4771289.1 AAA family ATPase [Methanosarcina sp. DH2]